MDMDMDMDMDDRRNDTQDVIAAMIPHDVENETELENEQGQ